MAEKKSPEAIKAFWNVKAKRYPLPFDPKTLRKTEEIIALAKGRGAMVPGARILDIGCGTGIFTLPLAREAARVTGVDFSETMLSRLNEEAGSRGIKNVDVLYSTWKDADIKELAFQRAYDTVWSSMSAAIRNEGDLEKMEACSQQWCVFIGWGSMRKNTLLERAFELHHLTLSPPPGAYSIYGMLKNRGIKPTLDFIDTSWEWEGAVDEAMEDIGGHIEMQGTVCNKAVLRELLVQEAHDNVIHHTTYAEQGVIVWRVA
jgi:SAM-dependent methyltransferase